MSILLAFQGAPPAEPDLLVSLEAEEFLETVEDLSQLLDIEPPEALVVFDLFTGLEAESFEEDFVEGSTGIFVEDDILAPILDSVFDEEDFVPDDNFAVFDLEELVLFALEAIEDLDELVLDEIGSALPDEPLPPEPIEFLYSLSDEFVFDEETGIGIDIPDVLVETPTAAAIHEWIIRARRRRRR